MYNVYCETIDKQKIQSVLAIRQGTLFSISSYREFWTLNIVQCETIHKQKRQAIKKPVAMIDLYVEAEKNYVAVIHYIFLAFGAYKSLFLCRRH